MFHSSNPLRNDNPGWPISNATETAKVANGGLSALGDPVRRACGITTAWLIGLPRRAGRRIYALNDEEAGWHSWQVTEMLSGLGRQYRDWRWDALRYDPTLRRDEFLGDAARSGDTGCPLG